MSALQKMSAGFLTALGLICTGGWTWAQGTPAPRPGLTAQQTQKAVEIAQEAMVELRKKSEGANKPEVDHREYVVAVELLPAKRAESEAGGTSEKPEEAGQQPKEKVQGKEQVKSTGPLAVVTSYRYFDDVTVFATIDLGTGRVVDIESARHLRTPLSNEEYEDAQALAREKSDEVKALFKRFGDKLSVYPQFSQFTAKDEPRIHRVVHLTYRVGTKDLSYPRPVIDLTTREVSTPPPEASSKTREPRP